MLRCYAVTTKESGRCVFWKFQLKIYTELCKEQRKITFSRHRNDHISDTNKNRF